MKLEKIDFLTEKLEQATELSGNLKTDRENTIILLLNDILTELKDLNSKITTP